MAEMAEMEKTKSKALRKGCRVVGSMITSSCVMNIHQNNKVITCSQIIHSLVDN